MMALIVTQLINFKYLAAMSTCKLESNSVHSFFGLPHWWEYMQGSPDGIGGCSPVFTGVNDVFPVGLAILDILLRLAGFVAVVGVIIGGISYLLAIGNPEKITSSRKTIQNALIGLAIALIADQIVAFIGKSLLP